MLYVFIGGVNAPSIFYSCGAGTRAAEGDSKENDFIGT